jgi:hypothetical protein
LRNTCFPEEDIMANLCRAVWVLVGVTLLTGPGFADEPATGGKPLPPGSQGGAGEQPPPPPDQPAAPGTGFNYKISPGTSLTDLLPTPPRCRALIGPVLTDDLAQVPEVAFGQPLFHKAAPQARQAIGRQIAKIMHLNKDRTDGFMEALASRRPDMSGLPLVMGDACRMKAERSRQFRIAVDSVRAAQANALGALMPDMKGGGFGPQMPGGPGGPPGGGFGFSGPGFPGGGGVSGVVRTSGGVDAAGLAAILQQVATGQPAVPSSTADAFWDLYLATCRQDDKANARADKVEREHIALARIAALMQILAPESAGHRKGLVKYLGGVPHVEATRAIARLAIFSAEEEVREAAVEALKVRRENDYTCVLVDGLRYPWPPVAKRSAEVLVKLDRQDVVPQLIDALETPDPRLPVREEVDGNSVSVVRELVKLNHHRNCLLCHAPGESISQFKGKEPPAMPDVPVGAIPIPGEPLPTPSQGYQPQPQDLIVRLDVTYLRQDFSAMLPVPDANPWPTQQRFDFMVRTRLLSEPEAAVFQEKLQKREPGSVTPYERAILAALRDLTGRDTEPTAAAWRKMLGLASPARSGRAIP